MFHKLVSLVLLINVVTSLEIPLNAVAFCGMTCRTREKRGKRWAAAVSFLATVLTLPPPIFFPLPHLEVRVIPPATIGAGGTSNSPEHRSAGGTSNSPEHTSASGISNICPRLYFCLLPIAFCLFPFLPRQQPLNLIQLHQRLHGREAVDVEADDGLLDFEQ